MTKQKSMKKNFVYNFILTGFNLLFPIITAPYVSRILGATNLGKVNFATAVVNWFILFAVFGTTTYGVRAIAKNRDNKEELSKVFSELILIKTIASIVVLIVYVTSIYTVENLKSENLLFLIFSINIILNIFSIDWFYQGIEEYRYITIRSVIFKFLSFISIFIFITRPSDYIIYGLISILANSLSNILNYIYSKKFVKVSLKAINLSKHIKGLVIMGLISIIVNIYTTFDQVLLGFMTNKKDVAFLNRCRVVTAGAISLTTALLNITLPRASYYFKNNIDKFKELLVKVPKYILFVSIPLTLLVIINAEQIMYILGGQEFLEASNMLKIIALIIILAPLGSWLQSQIIIPTENEKTGLKISIATSLVSIVANIILIRRFGYIATAVVAVASELIGFMFRYYFSKSKLGFKQISLWNNSTKIYLISGTFMTLAMYFINTSNNLNMFIEFIISSTAGFIIYGILLMILREEIIWEVINMCLKKIRLKKHSI